jgi:hypothetical protein
LSNDERGGFIVDDVASPWITLVLDASCDEAESDA